MDETKINGIQTMINIFKRDPTKVWTPRMMGQQMAFMGFGQCPVGTPEMIADVIEEWAVEGSIDGFNVACMMLRLPLFSQIHADSTNSRRQQSHQLRRYSLHNVNSKHHLTHCLQILSTSSSPSSRSAG